MELRLYNFSKKHNSTKQLLADAEPLAVYSDVCLKQTTDIDSPVFLLDDTFRAANYAYLVDLGRFYFINKNRLGNNWIYEIECELDALATYKSYILLYQAFVERCADSRFYNVDIPDAALSVEDAIEHSSSASTYCSIATGLMYIVRILGRDDTGGIGTYVMNQYTLADFFGGLWGDIDDDTIVGDIPELVKIAISNPAQYVIGCYSSPIGASVYGAHTTSSHVYIGGHDTNISLDKITSGTAQIAQGLALAKPTGIYTDFRRTDPAFSQYTIYIPTVGTLGLSADLMETNLTMDIGADLMSGDLLFTLKSDGDIVASYQSNCYATQSLGGVNQAGSIFAGALGTAVALTTGNIGGIIEGIKTAMSPSPAVIGSQGGTGCTALANEIVITCQQKSSAEFPTAVYGRPCCKNLVLGNLTGFIKCGGASIELPANEAVKMQINNFLNEGFYLE